MGAAAAFGGRPAFVGTIMEGYFFIVLLMFLHLVHLLGYLLT
jgi:hypothetical protein